MNRRQSRELSDWISRPRRKPLIIRGARQVGKSTLVRLFAARESRRLVEVNLERFPDLRSTFASLDVNQIINVLEALPNIGSISDDDLIFLDEIQTIPQAITALRYFYEDRREIPLIAAGSLFDFALADHSLSMPVGRVEYLHMVPMTFVEFLDALGENRLAQVARNFDFTQEIGDFIHRRLDALVRAYSFVGGMPEAVEIFADSQRFSDARRIHVDIVESFRDDFPKYLNIKKLQRIVDILNTVARSVGRKVKYVNYDRALPSRDVKSDLEHLCLARLISKVVHSYCNGTPLHAEEEPNVYKLLFLDVGLMNAICGVNWYDFHQVTSDKLVNQGAIAEQFVGQHLLAAQTNFVNRELNYWLREKNVNNAEVDFVIAIGNVVVPIEVKSGASGTLKSLHQFVAEKRVKLAIRFDTNPPSKQRVQTKVRIGQESVSVDYTLISLPLYLVESLHSIVTNWYGISSIGGLGDSV